MDIFKELFFCPASEELPDLEREREENVAILVNVNFVKLQIVSIKLDFVLIFPH